MKRRDVAILFLLTLAALLVHGYHPFAEDAEIYVPSIVKILHPSYYSFGEKFFEANGRLTAFPHLMAALVRLTHLPLEWILFCGYVASIFLLLLACVRVATKCFSTPPGRWSAVTLIACLLTLPVAGTSLYIFDQYLNPRSISAFAVVFAIDAAMENRYWRMMLWLLLTAAIHPFMTVFAVIFIVLWLFRNRESSRVPAMSAACLIPFAGFALRAPSAIYWRCLEAHRYYFLRRWTWYEWLGILAPLGILWCCKRIAKARGHAMLVRLTWTVFIFEAICFVAGLIVTIPHQLEILAPYQPMRSLQLAYLLLFLVIGGLLGEYVLKKHLLRWVVLFVPIAAGLCVAQIQLFPATRHVEWPGAAPINPWLQAFAWVRQNTPTEAILALDPNYMALPEENYQGFRAAAERSRLADAKKDWSDAVLYPWLPLADNVFAQTQAAAGWKNFGVADFAGLKAEYGVSWIVLQQPGTYGLDCPYQNSAVKVCHIE
ncbi:MAG TPA: hypothetical protein VKB26_01330 [Candidatus Acidoferrales bacterium]|nr:hypothetical protein [Candidatus Acidoferrales bacterium]